MTWFVALLTLAALPDRLAPTDAAAAERVVATERIVLPAATLSVQVRALEGLVVLGCRRSRPALLRALRARKLTLCPEVIEAPGELRLRCRTRFLEARAEPAAGATVLEITEVRGLPATGIDAPALAAFVPERAGLGAACPGSTAGGRAECRLAQGSRAGMRAALDEVYEGPPRSHAELRLGDLALAEGQPYRAALRWGQVRDEPWSRLAAARVCELSRACLAAADLDRLYDLAGLPPALANDLALRHARALAFLGRPVEAVRAVLQASQKASPCAASPGTCQRLVLAALLDPAADPAELVALWTQVPERDRGPGAYEAELAVAAHAEKLGAPAYAANVLAAGAGRVPPEALAAYLLRTAELYLAAGDRIRAGVVLDFARSRAGRKGLPGARWAAVVRDVTRRDPPRATPAPEIPADPAVPPPGERDVALISAARQVVEAARSSSQGEQP